jgi:hypothetical protein
VAQEPPANKGPGDIKGKKMFDSVGQSDSSPSTPGTKHRQKLGAFSTSSGFDPSVVTIRKSSVAGGASDSGPVSTIRQPRPGTSLSNTPARGSGYSYNSDAAKVVGSDSGGPSTGESGGGNASPSGAAVSGGSGYVYDDDASKSVGGDGGSIGEGRSASGGGTASEENNSRGIGGDSLFKDVSAGSGILDDDFFTKLRLGNDDEKDPKKKKKQGLPGEGIREPSGRKSIKEITVKYGTPSGDESGSGDSSGSE